MRNRVPRWAAYCAWLLCAAFACAQALAAPPVRVLAASDLKFALARVAEQYQRETGQTVSVSYGSSGNMARQIQQGLGADLYMSADETLVFQLAQNGLTRRFVGSPGSGVPATVADQGVLYALGRLALVAARDTTIDLDPDLQGLRKAWPMVTKFAIANPEHAPYGRAAQQLLQAKDLWETVQPRLVRGENIAQATQFVATGAAQAGITALSLVMAPELAGQLRYVALSAQDHAPLRQRMVLLANASAAADAFYRYLQQPAARAVLARYGFLPPP